MQTESTSRPPIDTHLFGFTREEWLQFLRKFHRAWDWEIGRRRLGDAHFRSEYPEHEIVSQWQPVHGIRAQRYAVYARRRDA